MWAAGVDGAHRGVPMGGAAKPHLALGYLAHGLVPLAFEARHTSLRRCCLRLVKAICHQCGRRDPQENQEQRCE